MRETAEAPIVRLCARNRAQRDFLSQKLEEVDAQLREAKADRRESERDRRAGEAVDQLKRFFPGAWPWPRRSALHAAARPADNASQTRAHLCRALATNMWRGKQQELGCSVKAWWTPAWAGAHASFGSRMRRGVWASDGAGQGDSAQVQSGHGSRHGARPGQRHLRLRGHCQGVHPLAAPEPSGPHDILPPGRCEGQGDGSAQTLSHRSQFCIISAY